MSDDWRRLIGDFLAGSLDAAGFHDGFLALWRRDRDAGLPEAVDRLFYVVEAFTPDPALRQPDQPWEAGEAELRQAARQALRDLGEQG